MRGGTTGDRAGYLSMSRILRCLNVNEFIYSHPDMGGREYMQKHGLVVFWSIKI